MKKFVFVLLSFVLPARALAHVGYVIDPLNMSTHTGADFPYLLSAITDPFNIILMLFTVALVLVLYWVAHNNRFLKKYFAKVRTKLEKYDVFIPWIIRLSLGIALIGASSAQVLISPLLSGFDAFALMQLILGFLLLAGFLSIPAAVFTCVLYIYAIIHTPYLLGNLEFLAGAIAYIVLANPKPGIDDIFMKKIKVEQDLSRFVPLILRLGLGISLIYLSLYEKIFNPHLSELVVSKFQLTSVIGVSPEMWIFSAGIIELLVGLFLLIGFHTRLTSAIAFTVITVTFFFFKEDVYSHITLFGLLSVLFITGSGNTTAPPTPKEKSPIKKSAK